MPLSPPPPPKKKEKSGAKEPVKVFVRSYCAWQSSIHTPQSDLDSLLSSLVCNGLLHTSALSLPRTQLPTPLSAGMEAAEGAERRRRGAEAMALDSSDVVGDVEDAVYAVTQSTPRTPQALIPHLALVADSLEAAENR